MGYLWLKRVSTFGMAAALLTACGGEDGEGNPGGTTGAPSATTDSTTATTGGTTAGTTGGSANDASVPSSLTPDSVRGGRLYDKWWAEIKAAEPTTDHPLWANRPDPMSNARLGADTWRCKECHGWDYKGAAGAYAMGSHATGFAGVLGTTKTAEELIAALRDPAGHAYGEVLSEQDLVDLAAFLTTRLIDVSTYIGADGAFVGDVTAGGAKFAECAACHGEQGLNTTVVGGMPGFEDFPGLIANDNPQEFLHKTRFGQPGTAMPALADMPEVLGGLGAFSQTLPQAPTE